MDPKAVILKNRGVLLEMAAVAQDGDRWCAVVADEQTGEPKLEQVRVRFTANEVADIEELFGSIGKFQEAMSDKPTWATRKAIAIATGRDEKAVGAAMLPDKAGEYLLDVQIAWAVAMGMDPTQAVQTIEEGHRAMKQAQEDARAQIDRDLAGAAETDVASTPTSPSPGTNGTGPGSEPREIPSSSGV